MSEYTEEDVKSYFHQPLTPTQVAGVLAYLNEGKIPAADPCLSCEPNLVRRLIGEVQRERRVTGDFPRVQASPALVVADEAENVAEAILENIDEGTKGLLISGGPTEVESPKPKPRKAR